MRRMFTTLLIVLTIATVAVTFYYELFYDKAEHKNIVKELEISDGNQNGKFGDYEYTISRDCGINLSNGQYNFTNRGFYDIAYKQPDSPQYYIITAGNFMNVSITKLSLLNNELVINVKEESISNSFENPLCIKVTKNGVFPNFTGITIKNQDGIIYDKLSIYKKASYEIGSEGIIPGTDTSYKIIENCPIKDPDLNNKGYYTNTFNMPNSPYYFLITLGEKPNGCYGIKVDDIKFNNNYLTINVLSSHVDSDCTDEEVYPNVCVEISNSKGYYTVIINEIIEEDVLMQLQPLN